MGPRSVFVVCVLAASAGGALAQPVAFLRAEQRAGAEPVFEVVNRDETAGTEAVVAEGLETAVWFYGLGDWGSHNYSAARQDGAADDQFGGLLPSELIGNSQVVVFGVDLGERVVAMEVGEFAVLCERAGVEWEAGARRAAIPVRRIEGSKVLVRRLGQAEVVSGQAATVKRGERAEIRPLFDPTSLHAPSVFPVRVYFDGDSAKGCDVLATHVATGATQRVTADDKGIANLELHEGGAWRVEYHRLTPAGNEDPEAMWVCYSATLSFEVVGGGR